ncbi:helix-turn-helix domain-containing protein [Ectopseudomonas khazarica]|uniref:helix-turn-helix domain-containing protein n=1 Tax=Ectopseudomonas khazarica TaxID=2502979 RepID=UPI003B952AD9
MALKSYANVWDALLDTPEEAVNMQLRSKLMMECEELVKSWNVTQKEAAKRLQITQPRLNDLLSGKLHKFSLDALVNLLSNADQSVEIIVRPRPEAA